MERRPRAPAAPAPTDVLDVGAGTGFLSLLAARLGHRVTAVDFSAEMLARLSAKAADQGLEVDVVEGSAEAVPAGRFDAVIERHVVWTLPDPVATLDTWRATAPDGRLLLFESAWGRAGDTREARAIETADSAPEGTFPDPVGALGDGRRGCEVQAVDDVPCARRARAPAATRAALAGDRTASRAPSC